MDKTENGWAWLGHLALAFVVAVSLTFAPVVVTKIPVPGPSPGASQVKATQYDVTTANNTTVINAVIANASSGDVIQFANGTYNFTAPLSVAVANVTLRGDTANPETVIINGISAGASPDCVVRINASNVTFEGFTVKLSPVNGIGINYATTGVTVQHNIISDGSTGCGILLIYDNNVGTIVDSATVSNNLITKGTTSGYHTGINLMSSVKNSTISDNRITGLGEGIWVDGGDTGRLTEGNTISGNTITGSSASGIILGVYGSWISNIFKDNVIEGNTISENGENGIRIDADLIITDLVITGNDITDNTNDGIDIATNVTWGAGNTINHNNIYNNTATGLDNTSGVWVNATNNWWGHANGPSGQGPGKYGVADAISANVTYYKWLTSAYPGGVATSVEQNRLIAYNDTSAITVDDPAVINVTVANTTAYNITDSTTTMQVLKMSGPGDITYGKKSTANGTANTPYQFNVFVSQAGDYELKVLETTTTLLPALVTQHYAGVVSGVTVTADKAQLVANATDTVNVTLQLDQPKQGATVTWSIGNKTAANIGEVHKDTVTNSSGAALLTLNATNTGYAINVTGTADVGGGVSYTDYAEFTTISGPVSTVNITSLAANFNATVATVVPVVLNVTDVQGNGVASTDVGLASNATTASFASDTVTTNATGIATVNLTFPQTAGWFNITATSVVNASANQTINLQALAGNVTQIEPSPASIALPNVVSRNQSVTLQLADVYGNDNTTAAATNLLITNSEPTKGYLNAAANATSLNVTTNATGAASFTYVVNTTDVYSATLTVNATAYYPDVPLLTIPVTTSGAGGVTITANVTLQAVTEDVLLTVNITDPSGDFLPLSDVPITLITTGGTLGNISLVSVFGTNSTTLTSTAAGPVTVTAYIPSYHNSTTVTFSENATALVVTPEVSSPTVNGTCNLTVQAKDSSGYNASIYNGASIAGQPIVFVVTPSGATLGLDSVTLDGTGQATNNITSATANTLYTITAAGIGTTGTANVTFRPILVSIAALPSSVNLTAVNETAQLAITATYSDNSTATVTANSTYASDNVTVATVSTGGLITAVGEGSATVTVSYTEDEITKTAEVSVTVVVEWTPWVYDTSGDDVIQKTEALAAVVDYFDLKISKAQALEVIALYFG